MFRLLKLCLGLAAFLVVAWFGATVKLGDRTLFEHLHAIGQTKESRELVDGTKKAAEPLVDDVRRRIGHNKDDGTDKTDRDDKGGAKAARGELPAIPPDAPAAQDDFSPNEKRQLRRLIGAVPHHASRE
jgi:hypothetical protein